MGRLKIDFQSPKDTEITRQLRKFRNFTGVKMHKKSPKEQISGALYEFSMQN